MTAYYNENDPYAAAWLRNLIAAGHIAPGDVDERSIEDVRPVDLLGYTQCHFFAGIGVWSHALRCAEWPDERPVWTGSCPCQPFSAAGKGGGFADERHLWPAWFHLIAHAKPRDVPVFGEQVASKDGLAWLDVVHADMEGQGYSIGAVDLCAAGAGAPHIRQRLFFVADASGAGVRDHGRGPDAGTTRGSEGEGQERQRLRALARDGGGRACALADTDSERRLEHALIRQGSQDHSEIARSGVAGELADTEILGCPEGREREQDGKAIESLRQGDADLMGNARGEHEGSLSGLSRGAQSECARSATNGFWRDADWLPCRDGKARPVEPGTFPLVAGAPARVGRLRAYGNAIVAPITTEFICAYLEGLALSEIL